MLWFFGNRRMDEAEHKVELLENRLESDQKQRYTLTDELGDQINKEKGDRKREYTEGMMRARAAMVEATKRLEDNIASLSSKVEGHIHAVLAEFCYEVRTLQDKSAPGEEPSLELHSFYYKAKEDAIDHLRGEMAEGYVVYNQKITDYSKAGSGRHEGIEGEVPHEAVQLYARSKRPEVKVVEHGLVRSWD